MNSLSKVDSAIPQPIVLDLDQKYVIMKEFLLRLRDQNLLLTQDEFNERKITPVIKKGHNFSRLIGRQCIETAIEINRLTRIRVPRKFAVLKRGSSKISLCEKLFSKEITVYAEQILEEYRPLTIDESRDLMKVVTTTGYSDCYRRNLITTNDHVYIIDTELKEFYPFDDCSEYFHFLKNSVGEEQREILTEELDDQDVNLTSVNLKCAKLTNCLGCSFEFSLEEIVWV